MLGLNQLDAQTLAQLQQMNPNYMQQFNPTSNPAQSSSNQKHLLQQNYSFDEQLPSSYYDGINHRMNILQQAQSHSFNMDMLSGIHAPNQPLDFLAQQQYDTFQRNNPKRTTLRRGQRVDNNSTEDLSNMQSGPGGIDMNLMSSLSPQQQQQLLLMRNQQYSNNSSGQESGIGTGSSVYTNSAHGTNDLLHSNFQHHPHHHPHHHQQHQHHQQPSSSSQNNQSCLSPRTSAQLKQTESTHLDIPIVQPQLPRRKSLPSIVKSKSFKEDETAHSSSDLNDKNQEIFIIENGIRKRVTEKSNSALNQNKLANDPSNPSSHNYNNSNANDNANEYDPNDDSALTNKFKHNYEYDEEQTPQLPRKIILESVNSLNTNKPNAKRVSMPSIPAYLSPKFANKGTKKNKKKSIMFIID